MPPQQRAKICTLFWTAFSSALRQSLRCSVFCASSHREATKVGHHRSNSPNTARNQVPPVAVEMYKYFLNRSAPSVMRNLMKFLSVSAFLNIARRILSLAVQQTEPLRDFMMKCQSAIIRLVVVAEMCYHWGVALGFLSAS